jgi:hypothetical protein
MKFSGLVMAALLCSCSSPALVTSTPFTPSTGLAVPVTASSVHAAHYIQLNDSNPEDHLKLIDEYCSTSETPQKNCTDEYQVKPSDRNALVLKDVDAEFLGKVRERHRPTTDYITAQNERGKYPEGYTANGEKMPACFKNPSSRKCQQAEDQYKIRGPGFRLCLNKSFTGGSLIVERFASSGERYYGKVVSAEPCK